MKIFGRIWKAEIIKFLAVFILSLFFININGQENEDPCTKAYKACLHYHTGDEVCRKQCEEKYSLCKHLYSRYKSLSDQFHKCNESIIRCNRREPEPMHFHNVLTGKSCTNEEYRTSADKRYTTKIKKCEDDKNCIDQAKKELEASQEYYKKWTDHKSKCVAEYNSLCEGDVTQLQEKLVYANNALISLTTSFNKCEKKDADGDGIHDEYDECPETPLGINVDVRGCPEGLNLRVYAQENFENWGKPLIYKPGAMAIINGHLKDKHGKDVNGANILIEVVETNIETRTFTGTIFNPKGNFEALLPLPEDLNSGTYTAQVTASYQGYPSVTKMSFIEVGIEPKPQLPKLFIDRDGFLGGVRSHNYRINWKRENNYWIQNNIQPNSALVKNVYVRTKDDEYISGVEVKFIHTHLSSGKSFERIIKTSKSNQDRRPQATYSYAHSLKDTGYWSLKVVAFKEDFRSDLIQIKYPVGLHLIEITSLTRDMRCAPHCVPHCQWRMVVYDAPTSYYRNNRCYTSGKCTLGHKVKYKWTSEDGFIADPESKSITWGPPRKSGLYDIFGSVICSEDPSVKATTKMKVEVQSDKEFNEWFYYGDIKLYGFDAVKIENIEGDEDDPPYLLDQNYNDITELSEGRWIKDESVIIETPLDSKVTLGIYKKGVKVGVVNLNEVSIFNIKKFRRSKLGFYEFCGMSGYANPYSIMFAKEILPDNRWNEWRDGGLWQGVVITRGTSYFIAYDPSNEKPIIGVLEGEISIVPRLFQDEPRTITDGEYLTIDNTSFSSVSKMTLEEITFLEEVFNSEDGQVADKNKIGKSLHSEDKKEKSDNVSTYPSSSGRKFSWDDIDEETITIGAILSAGLIFMFGLLFFRKKKKRLNHIDTIYQENKSNSNIYPITPKSKTVATMKNNRRFCPHCGSSIELKNKFCEECGNKLN